MSKRKLLPVGSLVRIPPTAGSGKQHIGRVGKISEIDKSTKCYVIDFMDEDEDLQDYDYDELSESDLVDPAKWSANKQELATKILALIESAEQDILEKDVLLQQIPRSDVTRLTILMNAITELCKEVIKE